MVVLNAADRLSASLHFAVVTLEVDSVSLLCFGCLQFRIFSFACTQCVRIICQDKRVHQTKPLAQLYWKPVHVYIYDTYLCCSKPPTTAIFIQFTNSDVESKLRCNEKTTIRFHDQLQFIRRGLFEQACDDDDFDFKWISTNRLWHAISPQ